MSFSRLPQQYRAKDERQIFSPDDLRPGLHIAVAHVVDGAGFGAKILKAGAAATGFAARQPDENRRQAARRGWRHLDGGLSPLWHGIVDQIDDDAVAVQVRGLAEPGQSAYFRQDPLSLPALEEPIMALHSFRSIGLLPEMPAPKPLTPIEARYVELDRVWQPVVTLRIA